MCGADHGPDHDDPAAATLCDRSHAFARADLPRLEAALDAHEKELLWQVALGVGPDGLARRFGVEVTHVRGELNDLVQRLDELALGGATS